ncbi:MAG: YwaF family protein, partial [Planctomycetota bacterium]
MEQVGPIHLATFAVGAVACVVAVRAGRQGVTWPGRALAMAILGAQIADPFIGACYGWLTWRNALPLGFCDAASFAVVAALWTRRQVAFELAYFWGLSGNFQAILSPDLQLTFPHPEYIRFFTVHLGILVGVFYLGPGVGMAPRRGAEWRVFGWTAIYTAFLALVNLAFGCNYMYLCTKPEGWTPLNWFGEWPWYIAGGALIALVSFWLLALP